MIKLIGWGIFFFLSLILWFYLLSKTGLLDKLEKLEKEIKNK